MLDPVTILGLVAASLTTFSGLPQLIKTWKTKSTKDMSLLLFLMMFVGVLLWLIYGILTGDVPLIAGNGVGALLVGAILALKLKYD